MAIISAYLKEKILVSSFKSTLHFDGKTLKEMVKGKCMKNDRLAVLVVCEEESYLFGVPALESSSGENQYNAIMTLLEEFELSYHLIGIVFDTTSSNTGLTKGAVTRVAQALDMFLLQLACRHHVNELRIENFMLV